MSEVLRIGSIIIFYLSKLWKAKFFILYELLFLVRPQGKFEVDQLLGLKGLISQHSRNSVRIRIRAKGSVRASFGLSNLKTRRFGSEGPFDASQRVPTQVRIVGVGKSNWSRLTEGRACIVGGEGKGRGQEEWGGRGKVGCTFLFSFPRVFPSPGPLLTL